MPGGFVAKPTPGNAWAATRSGGFGQCCDSCTALSKCRGTNNSARTVRIRPSSSRSAPPPPPLCLGWNYHNGTCALYSKVAARGPCPVDAGETLSSCLSGQSGGYDTWTPLPQNFRENGYMTLGVGKYYHDECHSFGGAKGDRSHPGGQGQPPMADAALSWTENSFQFPGKYTVAVAALCVLRVLHCTTVLASSAAAVPVSQTS